MVAKISRVSQVHDLRTPNRVAIPFFLIIGVSGLIVYRVRPIPAYTVLPFRFSCTLVAFKTAEAF